MNTETKSIESFLQSVCRFISTEEKAKDIQDELRDHICSYVEEYTKDGMNNEDATIMALKQMGDPNILSKMYKEKTYKANRLFRIFSIALISSIFIISDFIYFYINSYNSLEGFLSIILTVIITCQCVTEIIDFIRICKKDGELSKKDPIFYIQSYKQSIWEERVSKYVQLFFLAICFILLISLIVKFSKMESIETLSSSLLTINDLSFMLLMIMSISIFNPKRKNTIVYDEGILMFSAFVSWDNIGGYMWSKESINGKDCYSLEFSTKKTSMFKKSSTISVARAPIKVSSSQVSLMNELFKKNNIEEIRR